MGAGAWPPDQRDAWSDRFNAGMRGAKGSHYDGGHRFDETRPVTSGSTGVRFEVELPAGETEIKTRLIDPDGTTRGAF